MYWLDGQDVPMHPARHRYMRNTFRERSLALAIDDLRTLAEELRYWVVKGSYSRWKIAAADLVDAHLHLVVLDEKFACEDGLTTRERSRRRLDRLAASWDADIHRSTFDTARARYLATTRARRLAPAPSVPTPTRPHTSAVAVISPRAVPPPVGSIVQPRTGVTGTCRHLDNTSVLLLKALERESRERELETRVKSLTEKMEQEYWRFREEVKAARAECQSSISQLRADLEHFERRQSTTTATPCGSPSMPPAPRRAPVAVSPIPQPSTRSVPAITPRIPVDVPPVPQRTLPAPSAVTPAPIATFPAPTATPPVPIAASFAVAQTVRDVVEVMTTVPEETTSLPMASPRRRRRGRRRRARNPKDSASGLLPSGARDAAGVLRHGAPVHATPSSSSVSALPPRVRQVPPKPALPQLPPARSRPTPAKDPPTTGQQVITCPPKEFSRLQAALRTASRALSVVSNSRTYAMVAAGLVTPLRLTI